MHKDGEIRRLRGRNDALQKSQLQLKQKMKQMSQPDVHNVDDNQASQHLRKANKRLRRLSEQLSNTAKEHQQEVAQLEKNNIRLREENGHLRGMPSLPLFSETVHRNPNPTGSSPSHRDARHGTL